MSKRPTLTTDSGMPVADNQNSITAGPRGPVLMQDFLLFEKLAHQNRERIPERGQHAKGSGAYGTLTIARLCAALLYRRGQLGPRRQQHAGVFRARRAQVSGL